MKSDREEVYAALDGERKYQTDRWGANHDDTKGVGDFLVYMEHYMSLAKAAYTTALGDTAALDVIRKVTALGVACMEHNGTIRRENY